MTQTANRPESRVDVFSEFRPEDRIVHLRDRWDGFTFATTVAGIDEQLAIDPTLEILDY